MTGAEEGGSGYYSSEQKDFVREQFDKPLVAAVRQQRQKKLRYFGLPGADCLDVLAWRADIDFVAAVEKYPNTLKLLERTLRTRLPDIQFTAHLGDADKVILKDGGLKRKIGGQPDRPVVSSRWEPDVNRRVWDFDIINLDYFGPLIPSEATGANGAPARRARAIRSLFDNSRQDAWQPWALLITVEARLNSDVERALLRAYLSQVAEVSSDDSRQCIGSALSLGAGEEETIALVSASTAAIVAGASANAGLLASSSGSVVYMGANSKTMIHLAYRFTPSQTFLPLPPALPELLSAPLLRAESTRGGIGFALWPVQPPTLDRQRLVDCLDFLGSEPVEQLASLL